MTTAMETLSALKDVTGVEGSFYATRDGRIVARDMPKIYDGDTFDGVATRLGRMLDALAELGGTNEGTLLRHPHHALFVRPTEHGILGVLATAEVNVPSLKRGASLVARRLPAPSTIDPIDLGARQSIQPSQDFTPIPQGLPTSPLGAPLLSPPPLPQTTMTFPSAPPPLPTTGGSHAGPPPIPQRASSPGSGAKPLPAAQSTPGSIAKPLPTQRASVPGAPAAAPAVRWRGTNLKD